MPAPQQLVIVDGDRLVIYPDKRKMLRRITLRLFPCFALLVGLNLFSASFDPGRSLFLSMYFTVLPVCVLLMYVAMAIRITRQSKPIVQLAPEGLYVHTMMTDIGLIRWEEISNIFAYNLGYRFVGIVPLDPAGLYRRAGKNGILARMNEFVAPLYRSFGTTVAPINVPQEYLPMTADELIAQLNHYRSTVRPWVDPSAWPPPPGA